ncbi:MAG: ion channel [Planctomycetia bacterium]
MPRFITSQTARQAIETVVILVVAGIVHEIWQRGLLPPSTLCWLVCGLALLKTAFFFAENLQHILLATAHEIPYHRFLGLMGVNMAQITMSFALDFFLLETAAEGSLSGFVAGLTEPRILFDCFFYSVLNFTFFGFGDITPQSIPAKLVTLMEVTLAFFTVIFLLSDFISLKDSLRGGRTEPQRSGRQRP